MGKRLAGWVTAAVLIGLQAPVRAAEAPPVPPGRAPEAVPEQTAEPPVPGITLGMAFQFYTTDYVGASPIANAYPIGWNRILFLPSGHASPELSFHSRFAIDNFGVSAAGLGSGHLRSSSLDIGSPFYVDWAYASYEPESAAYHVGLLNLNRAIRIGSTIPNPFDTSAVYSIGLARYGGVGTPPLTASGAIDAAPGRVGLWLMGTNVALETLDPNSTYVNFPAPALSLVHVRPLGQGRLTLATMDGTPGASPARARDPAQARALYLPSNYPATAPQRQGYSLALYDLPLAWGRLQLGWRTDNLALASWGGKYTTVTLDVGDHDFGGSLTLAGPGAPGDQLGAYLWGSQPWGGAMGLGLKAGGWKLLEPPSPTAFVSYGPMLRLPAWTWLPPLTLALQQTNGSEGRPLAAGVTLETSFKPAAALPEVHAEYSVGKFDPAGHNALFDPSRPFTHQVYSVLTTFSF